MFRNVNNAKVLNGEWDLQGSFKCADTEIWPPRGHFRGLFCLFLWRCLEPKQCLRRRRWGENVRGRLLRWWIKTIDPCLHVYGLFLCLFSTLFHIGLTLIMWFYFLIFTIPRLDEILLNQMGRTMFLKK